jgi:hypothetical protein
MTFAPVDWAISIIRPSTWWGTPEIIDFGGSPRRCGQLRRTRSWLPPMPPEVIRTACASTRPATPSTFPSVVVS